MPKYVTVVAHLSVDELASCYRKAADPDVSEVTRYCANWIRILERRYNQHGPLALADQRQCNPGATPLLSKEQMNQLQQILEEAPLDSGLWTSRKVAL